MAHLQTRQLPLHVKTCRSTKSPSARRFAASCDEECLSARLISYEVHSYAQQKISSAPCMRGCFFAPFAIAGAALMPARPRTAPTPELSHSFLPRLGLLQPNFHIPLAWPPVTKSKAPASRQVPHPPSPIERLDTLDNWWPSERSKCVALFLLTCRASDSMVAVHTVKPETITLVFVGHMRICSQAVQTWMSVQIDPIPETWHN